MPRYIILPLLFFSLLNFSCSLFQSGKDPGLDVDINIVSLKMSDGTILDGTVFYPTGKAPIIGWPVIILCHGFGRSKDDLLEYALAQARNGYYTLTYSMRGQGRSEGRSNFLSTVEMKDLFDVIDFVKEQKNVNNSRIGISGSSQGGIIPFMALANGLDVRCVISNLATPDFASSWIYNDCINTTLLWSLNYDSSVVRYSDEALKFREWILSGEKEDFDSLKMLLPNGRDFLDKVENVKVPIFMSNSWQDRFFISNGMIEVGNKLSSPKLMYLGAAGGHGSDASAEGHTFVAQNMEKWFAHYLYGKNNGVENLSTYMFAFSSYPVHKQMWSYKHFLTSGEFFSGSEKKIKFYFNSGNKLSLHYDPSNTESVSFKNSISDPELNMSEALLAEFKGKNFESKFQKDEIFFESETLDTNLYMLGIPQVNLFYTSSSDICQYNFQIWEVTPKGEANFITRINYTNWHNEPDQKNSSLISGVFHGHIFQKGNKIRIVITNLDTTPTDNFLRSNPYVLPVLKNASNKIFINPENQTYIEIPLIENVN